MNPPNTEKGPPSQSTPPPASRPEQIEPMTDQRDQQPPPASALEQIEPMTDQLDHGPPVSVSNPSGAAQAASRGSDASSGGALSDQLPCASADDSTRTDGESAAQTLEILRLHSHQDPRSRRSEIRVMQARILDGHTRF